MHKHKVRGPNCSEFLWCCLVLQTTSCCQQAAPAGEERYSAHLVWMEKGSLVDLLFPSWEPEGRFPVGIQSPNDDSLKTNSPVKVAFKHAAKAEAERSVICTWMWGNDSPWWKAVVLPKKGKIQRSQQHGNDSKQTSQPLLHFSPHGFFNMARDNVLCCRDVTWNACIIFQCTTFSNLYLPQVLGKSLWKCNILHITSYLNFKETYYPYHTTFEILKKKCKNNIYRTIE